MSSREERLARAAKKKRAAARAARTPWERARAWGFVPAVLLALVVGWWLDGVFWQAELDDEWATMDRAAQQTRAADWPEPVEVLAHLIEHTDDLVVVDPDVASSVTPEQLTELREAAAASRHPVRVGYVPGAFGNDGGYNYLDLAEEWALAAGWEGVYVVITSGGRASSYGIGYGDPGLWQETKGQPAAAIRRVVAAVDDLPVYHIGEDRQESLEELREENTVVAGIGGGVAMGVGLIGLFVITPVFGVIFALLGRRPARTRRSTG